MRNNLARQDTPPIQSLDSGLMILEALVQSTDPLPLSDFAKLLDVDHSSAFRLANTLRRRGFVAYLPDRKAYVLGSSIWRISHQYDWGTMLIRVSRDQLKLLASHAQNTAHLAIREGKQALFIDHAVANSVITVTGRTGELIPLHCTAHGKALLADSSPEDLRAICGREPFKAYTQQTTTSLEQLVKACARARTDGFAVDDCEYLEGIRCIASPIRAETGVTIGSIGISAPLERLPKDRFSVIGEQVACAAQQIAKIVAANSSAND
jgi:IclR family transcriptional regulator, acetate operon repressor